MPVGRQSKLMGSHISFQAQPNEIQMKMLAMH